MAMNQEFRKRILREATPDEKERHRVVREQVKQNLPEPPRMGTGVPLDEPVFIA